MPAAGSVPAPSTIAAAVSRFGADAGASLTAAAAGEPEDQLRRPFQNLLADVAAALGFAGGAVVAVGEVSLSDLRSRPDYAVDVQGATVGHVEVKAPGKGSDPRRLRDRHDAAQWAKLQSLPNLIYTDGNGFTLWRDGEPRAAVALDGDIRSAGADLAADDPAALAGLFADFLRWEPVPPRSARELAETCARLCKLMRAEVGEHLAEGSAPFVGLAEDWRRALFPEADDAAFADGYAQAVTFGLLLARTYDIDLTADLHAAAKRLGTKATVMGSALAVLTDDVTDSGTLRTSLGVLRRVLNVVNWDALAAREAAADGGDEADGEAGAGGADAWLYFYEGFLEVYDPKLRRETGSYYTPKEVVAQMCRLTDDLLRSPARFDRPRGLADAGVTVADPAVGAGTFLLGVLRRVADAAADAEGPGAVPGTVAAAAERLIGFERQLGPYAVAQVRVRAELKTLCGDAGSGAAAPAADLFLTDTLADPFAEKEYVPQSLKPLGDSRLRANAAKRTRPINVVIGNPPYKEKAKGRGGWVERELLPRWKPPARFSAHAKHLRNLYVYFWRWAAWTVFDRDPARIGAGERATLTDERRPGVVCYITVAGFLSGDGFAEMRGYLRRTCDEIWVIDCSPEGHQPEVRTRLFQGVQHEVCIVLASRSPGASRDLAKTATVRHRTLPPGTREEKFAALAAVQLDDDGWTDCPKHRHTPFLPARTGDWATFPALPDLFAYDGSGVMPGRIWPISPDRGSLAKRWDALLAAEPEAQDGLLRPHASGNPGMDHAPKKPLPASGERPGSLRNEAGPCPAPIPFAYRSFDRQWLIPDGRLLNRPNPKLWTAHGPKQVYLTALNTVSPVAGPAFTFTALIPEISHYKGSFGGRVFPLYRDAAASVPNLAPHLCDFLAERLGVPAPAADVLAYLAAVGAHPAYTARFADDLADRPGLRLPLTADPDLWAEAVAIGREVVWLHTYGARFADPAAARPPGKVELPPHRRPRVPADGAIPHAPDAMPDEIRHDPATNRLHVGDGFVEPVSAAVWAYEVSGKQVVKHWFSYRRRDRTRPLIGDRRPPSALNEIRPDRWLPEYTTDLLALLTVLTRLTDLEPRQAALLERILAAPRIDRAELSAAGALEIPAKWRTTLGGGRAPRRPRDGGTQSELFG